MNMMKYSFNLFLLLICFKRFIYASSLEFKIVDLGTAAPICFDSRNSAAVEIAAKALAGDIYSITDIKPQLMNFVPAGCSNAIIVGTLGQSRSIDDLAATGKISKQNVAGKGETFTIQTVDRPFLGVDKALVIAGSDPRGTGFGVFGFQKAGCVSLGVLGRCHTGETERA